MKRDNIIAEIEERDLTNLQQIGQEVFNNKTDYDKVSLFYKESKENKNIHVLGYYIEDNLVGTVILNILTLPSKKIATVWSLAIKEEYRRLGIATKLMNKAEEISKKEGIESIWLFSASNRKGAHELYRRLGYDENTNKAFIKNI